MASVIIIPIIVVAIVGLSAYLVYRLLVFDLLCKRSVRNTLARYNINKTPSEIIKEYYSRKGQKLSHREIQNMEKNYRQHEPEQFLAMYDANRENSKDRQ